MRCQQLCSNANKVTVNISTIVQYEMVELKNAFHPSLAIQIGDYQVIVFVDLFPDII